MTPYQKLKAEVAKLKSDLDIVVNEPSWIMIMACITPRLDYSQGNGWETDLVSPADLHVPALDGIGFQDLIQEQMAWWTTYQKLDGTWAKKSAGKQPAWTNYMTDVNTVRGNFAIKGNQQWQVLTRDYVPQYASDQGFDIVDLTTYVDPRKINQIFADTDLTSQNFWLQTSIDITARRKMSARVMPRL